MVFRVRDARPGDARLRLARLGRWRRFPTGKYLQFSRDELRATALDGITRASRTSRPGARSPERIAGPRGARIAALPFAGQNFHLYSVAVGLGPGVRHGDFDRRTFVGARAFDPGAEPGDFRA